MYRAGAATFFYDANGNLQQRRVIQGRTNYTWDAENQLKRATLPNLSFVEYKYDAFGRRIERRQSNNTWTRFSYDGADVILDTNSDGTTVKYLNGAGIDTKLRQTKSSEQVEYFLADHLGSTNALVNTSGAITSQTNYDAFGNATNTSFASRYQYTGREYDATTNLYYYRARWYSAETGRFISEDPIGFAGGDVNLYGYVKNNPFNLVDPSGNQGVGYADIMAD